MILICSAVFWVGPVRPLLRRVPVHRDLRRPGQGRSSSTSSACSSSRSWSCSSSRPGSSPTPAVPVARGRLPADHAGLGRPDLRLQVRRGDRLFELGLPPARQPDDGGLRDHGGGLAGVLRDVPPVPALVRADPGEPGGGRGDPGRERFPEASEDGLGLGLGALVALLVVTGVAALADARATLSTATGWAGLLGRLAFSQNPLWPSRWMSAGLLASARGEWPHRLFYLMVLSATPAWPTWSRRSSPATSTARGYSRVQGGRSSRRRHGWYGFDALFHRALLLPARGRSAS